MMKKLGALVLALVLMLAAGTALAADVFRFESREIDLFEGEEAQVPLVREGNPEAEGKLTYTAVNPKAVSVSEDGTIRALKKGKSTVKATLKTEKRSWTAAVTVNVLRPVTDVTLNTTQMKVFQPTDDTVAGLLRQETEYDVIVIPAGKSVDLSATCTPSDASSKKVVYASSDEGILKIGKSSAKAVQAGECDLTVSSASNPDVKETYHVLVTQPVTKISVSAPEGKTVAVGGTLQLEPAIEPSTASIQLVEWSSKNEKIATVDENGVVTGRKRGNTSIQVKAADGSGKSASISVTVAQLVTGISIQETEVNLANGQQSYVHATVYPSDANEKGVVWSSSDQTVATVTQSGQVKGIGRGECVIIATSKSNPDVTAEVNVNVVQRVTAITFPEGPVSLPVRTTAQLTWQVAPADATIQDVVFTSSNKNIATVDENGLVTGLSRGSATITATATDGSRKKGQVRVTVIQPVEAVSIQYQVYHVQLEGSLNIKAIVSPSNANNKNVHFTMGDEYIATVSDSGSIGRVRGWHTGTTTITGVTEDGGFSASAEVRVADFNRAIVVDDLYLEGENSIRIVLRNRSGFAVNRVNFICETYDRSGQPLVCNADGTSNSFVGSYRLELHPGDVSEHYQFDFGEYVQPTDQIGTVVVKVISWLDLEGYTRNIPESEYPSQSYTRYLPPTPSPVPEDPENG